MILNVIERKTKKPYMAIPFFNSVLIIESKTGMAKYVNALFFEQAYKVLTIIDGEITFSLTEIKE